MKLSDLTNRVRACISVFLAIVMVLGGVPVSAIAEGIALDPYGKADETAIEAQGILASGTWGTCPWEIDANGLLTVHPGEGVSTEGVSPWEDVSGDVTSVRFVSENGRKVIAPGQLSRMFEYFPNLRSADMSGLDTSRTTNMNSMFSNTPLTSINLTGWDTSNVTDMSHMFSYCDYYPPDILGLFDEDLFQTLDLTMLDTSSLQKATRMFYNQDMLSSIDTTGWDTSQLRDAEEMFCGCSQLSAFDASGWDTSQLSNAKDMFTGCNALASFKVGPTYNLAVGGAIPAPTSTNSKWLSKSTNTWFTPMQMAANRNGVADEYINASNGQSIVDDTRIDIINAVITGLHNVTYSRKANTADESNIVLTVFGTELVQGVDYTISYNGNLNSVGEVEVVFTGIGDYCGTKTSTYSILPDPVFDGNNAWITSIPDQTYTGNPIEPEVSFGFLPQVDFSFDNDNGSTGQDSEYLYIKGVDYTVAYADNINVGTATVTVTGIGNYSGSIWAHFNIVAPDQGPKNISSAIITVREPQVFSGLALTPSVEVTLNGVVLSEGTDYTVAYANNVDAGVATITVTGKGNYIGTATTTFEIAKADISGASISAIGSQRYTGSEIEPEPTVVVGTRTLVKDADYTLSYKDNIEPGNDATVIVTANPSGNYTGSVSATFAIVVGGSAFEWGKDNLNFNNTIKSDGTPTSFKPGRYIDQIDAYHEAMLRDHLNSKEKVRVFGGFEDYAKHYDGLAYSNWAGSCYGMSVVTLLAKAGYVPYSQYTAGASRLNQLATPKDNMDVSSLITYYFLLQKKDSIQNEFSNAARQKNDVKLAKVLELLKTHPLVHICISNDSQGFGHSVLAYGVEYGSWRQQDGVTYRGRILICDPNSSTQVNESFHLYFNPSSYEWEIPAYVKGYSIRSSYGASIDYVGASPAAMNDGGFLSVPSLIQTTDQLARLDAYALGDESTVRKLEEFDGTFQYSTSSDPDDIIERSSHVFSGEGKSTPGYILRDAKSAYEASQKSLQELVLTMDYEDAFMTASSAAGRRVIFDPSGYVMVSGDSASYSLSITMNEDCPTDWYDVGVVGKVADESSLRVVEDGYILESDGLAEGVIVKARNDFDVVKATFSADYPSVLIYETDGNTIGAKVDADNNGTYETVVFDGTGPDLSRDGWVDLPGGRKGYARGGKLVTGWLDLSGGKYRFDAAGRMLTGWNDVEVDGKVMRYYFNPASGNLVRGTWFEIDGRKYYFRPSGNLATGWATISDKGVDKKYYFEGDGTLVAGCWCDIDTGQGYYGHYYFRPSGSMATGWADIDGQKYWFRPSGNMANGFADVDDAYKRYFDDQGRMLTGWQTIGSKTYYFRPSGAMQTGTATIGGKQYRFSDKGVLIS